MVKECIILAGGKGKRLRPLTNNIPKCLAPVGGKPLLEHQKEFLEKQGIEKIILACGYLWKKIKKKYGDEFIYSVEEKPLGTGGAIKKALSHIEGEEFFVTNCDEYHDVNLDKLRKIGSNVIALSRFKSRFGIVESDKKYVKGFKQKPRLPYWASIGLYLLSKNIQLPDKGAIEDHTFPKLAAQRKLKAHKHEGVWFTVNTIKQLEKLENFLR